MSENTQSTAMPAVAEAASLLADAISQYRMLAAPRYTVSSAAVQVAVRDDALVARCKSVPCHPPAVWQPAVDAFVGWLKTASSTTHAHTPLASAVCGHAPATPIENNGHAETDVVDVNHLERESDDQNHDCDHRRDSDHRFADDDSADDGYAENELLTADRGGHPSDPNSAVSCAANLLGPLESMGIHVHALVTHPRHYHLIGCCTKTPPLIQAECRFADWLFVVSMERDVDCIGGMLLIERAVHEPTGTTVDLRCDLRCQNTTHQARALLFSFFASGETSIKAFLRKVFGGVDRVVDSVRSRGWSVKGAFSWSAIRNVFDLQHVECVRETDGTVVYIAFQDGLLCAAGYKYAMYDVPVASPPANVYGPDPPLVRGANQADVVIRDYDTTDDGDDRSRSLSKERQWLVDQGYIAPWVATCRWGARVSEPVIYMLDDYTTTDANDLAERVDRLADVIACRYGPDGSPEAQSVYGRRHLNGRSCDAALARCIAAPDRTWRISAPRRHIKSGERFIDPSRGLYASWTMQCDMIHTIDAGGQNARGPGLPFVRFHAHLVGIDGSSDTLEPTCAVHVALVLCQPAAPRGNVAASTTMADGEQCRLNVLSRLLAHSETPRDVSNLHPLSAFYRRMLLHPTDGTTVVSAFWECVSPHFSGSADAMANAVEWLMDEFDRCGRLFAAAPANNH